MPRNSRWQPCRGKGVWCCPMPIYISEKVSEFTYRPHKLVAYRETLLSYNRCFHIALLTLVVPHLVLFIVLAQEVSSNLVIEDAQHPTTVVLTGKRDTKVRLPRLLLMGHAGWSNLLLREFYAD